MGIKETAPRYPRVHDVADALQVSERTVWNWVSSGQIPSYRIGRSVFFKWTDIDEVLEAGKCMGTVWVGNLGRIIPTEQELAEYERMIANDVQQEFDLREPSRSSCGHPTGQLACS